MLGLGSDVNKDWTVDMQGQGSGQGLISLGLGYAHMSNSLLETLVYLKCNSDV